jgi:hypothetical protein
MGGGSGNPSKVLRNEAEEEAMPVEWGTLGQRWAAATAARRHAAAVRRQLAIDQVAAVLGAETASRILRGSIARDLLMVGVDG